MGVLAVLTNTPQAVKRFPRKEYLQYESAAYQRIKNVELLVNQATGNYSSLFDLKEPAALLVHSLEISTSQYANGLQWVLSFLDEENEILDFLTGVTDGVNFKRVLDGSLYLPKVPANLRVRWDIVGYVGAAKGKIGMGFEAYSLQEESALSEFGVPLIYFEN